MSTRYEIWSPSRGLIACTNYGHLRRLWATAQHEPYARYWAISTTVKG